MSVLGLFSRNRGSINSGTGSLEVLNLHILHPENEIAVISKQWINDQYAGTVALDGAEGQTTSR